MRQPWPCLAGGLTFTSAHVLLTLGTLNPSNISPNIYPAVSNASWGRAHVLAVPRLKTRPGVGPNTILREGE